MEFSREFALDLYCENVSQELCTELLWPNRISHTFTPPQHNHPHSNKLYTQCANIPTPQHAINAHSATISTPRRCKVGDCDKVFCRLMLYKVRGVWTARVNRKSHDSNLFRFTCVEVICVWCECIHTHSMLRTEDHAVWLCYAECNAGA